MQYNNFYNFKNPIRHFINIDNLTYPDNIATLDIDATCWTQPIKFRIQKEGIHFRTLKIPNILQFACAYEHIKTFNDFTSPQNMDITHKRLIPEVDTGDFKIGSYDQQLENDFNNLCVYDNLLKLDIKEFYGRIYTHYLDFNNISDRYITNLNLGATNGLIMGNYLSLFFAEQHLAKISEKIQNHLNAKNITCDFSYFSDDFYFFCNKSDNDNIINIFDTVLEEFDLSRNSNKLEQWDYQTYNQENLMTRYWKKINYYCNTHFSNTSTDNKLVFINQLIYRSSSLRTEKQKKVFINNFFKGKYFRELDTSHFKFRPYDYHQLCFLLRTSPESLLYTLDVLKTVPGFNKENMRKFFDVRYKEILSQPLHDIQLFYYYALELLEFNDILQKYNSNVLTSDNQVLISYYLINNLFEANQIETLKLYRDEKFWFQNYHLILKCPDLLENIDQSILTYLMPNIIRPVPSERNIAANRRETYKNFYKENLLAGKCIVNTISDVEMEIQDYLDLRFAEEALLYSLNN